MLLISACLLGINCKYNGKNNRCPAVIDLGQEISIIPVCPEQLGGLSTPRCPAEITGGDGKDVLEGKAGVFNEKGEEITSHFLKGASETLKIARMLGAEEALLKARSPSCGEGQIYSGSFDGQTKKGDGVTAALLKQKGIYVFTEEDFFPENM